MKIQINSLSRSKLYMGLLILLAEITSIIYCLVYFSGYEISRRYFSSRNSGYYYLIFAGISIFYSLIYKKETEAVGGVLIHNLIYITFVIGPIININIFFLVFIIPSPSALAILTLSLIGIWCLNNFYKIREDAIKILALLGLIGITGFLPVLVDRLYIRNKWQSSFIYESENTGETEFEEIIGIVESMSFTSISEGEEHFMGDDSWKEKIIGASTSDPILESLLLLDIFSFRKYEYSLFCGFYEEDMVFNFSTGLHSIRYIIKSSSGVIISELEGVTITYFNESNSNLDLYEFDGTVNAPVFVVSIIGRYFYLGRGFSSMPVAICGVAYKSTVILDFNYNVIAIWLAQYCLEESRFTSIL